MMLTSVAKLVTDTAQGHNDFLYVLWVRDRGCSRGQQLPRARVAHMKILATSLVLVLPECRVDILVVGMVCRGVTIGSL